MKKAKNPKFKYIFGPVESWRLGRSLGVDLTPQGKKICNFDCVYCQLGKTKQHISRRRQFVPTSAIISEIRKLPNVKIDYITITGYGEPTLAGNLGQTITAIKKIRKEPIAVLTNSGLIDRKDVQDELLKADFVMLKLDAVSAAMLKVMNNPAGEIEFDKILSGIKQFKNRFKGKIALQIMFTEENRRNAKDLAVLACGLNPDEIQINTPTRPCGRKPLSPEEVAEIKKYFSLFKTISVYDSRKEIDIAESYGDIPKRHPVE